MRVANAPLQFDTLPFGKITHGLLALAITLTTVLALGAAFIIAMSSLLTTKRMLDERAASIEHLNSELDVRSRELGDLFQLISADPNDVETFASPQKTQERLQAETAIFVEMFEQFGFTLQTQSEPLETAVSSALSVYQSRIMAIGDTEAVAKLLISSIEPDGNIASMTISGNDTTSGAVTFTAEINLSRIGARGAQPEGGGNE
ncbi:MAG: hypothetical protein AAFX54_00025 [Pseudomonadota bacterium]